MSGFRVEGLEFRVIRVLGLRVRAILPARVWRQLF